MTRFNIYSTREGLAFKPDAPAKRGPSLARQACGPLGTACRIVCAALVLAAGAGLTGAQEPGNPSGPAASPGSPPSSETRAAWQWFQEVPLPDRGQAKYVDFILT